MMSLKEILGAVTVTLTGIIAFIALWFLTGIEVFHLMFLSGVIAGAVGIALTFWLTRDGAVEESEPTSAFVDCDGLNVLIQRSRRSS